MVVISIPIPIPIPIPFSIQQLHALALAGYAWDDVPIRFQLHSSASSFSSFTFLPVIVPLLPPLFGFVSAFGWGFGFICCPSSALAGETLEQLARALPGRPALFSGWAVDAGSLPTWSASRVPGLSAVEVVNGSLSVLILLQDGVNRRFRCDGATLSGLSGVQMNLWIYVCSLTANEAISKQITNEMYLYSAMVFILLSKV